MLIAEVLNSDATVNSFEVIRSLGFIPGDAPKLVFRLKQPFRKDGLRYVAATGASMSVALPNKDGTITTMTAAALVGDASIWSVQLTAGITAVLSGGNFNFTLTEGAVVIQGYCEGGLSLYITGGCNTYGL